MFELQVRKSCEYGDEYHSRHVEAQGKPNKMLEKDCAKRSVVLLKESIQLGCVSQDSYPRKSVPRETGRL